MVSAQNVGFYRVIVFTRGGSRIGVSRFVSRRSDLALFIKVFQLGQAPSKIVRAAVCILVLHFCGIRPALGPISAHRHKCSSGDLAMIFLPPLYALKRERVVGIGG